LFISAPKTVPTTPQTAAATTKAVTNGQAQAGGQQQDADEDLKCKVPIMSAADGDVVEYTGQQLLAALAVVFLSYYWIDKKWTTDVTAYELTMPQSVLMC